MSSQLLKPPAGLFPGAVDRGDGCVSFALFAPGKRSVALIGDFNDWDRQADPLATTPEGLWWIVKHFEPGSYTYQFAVDGEVVICDPYARALAEDSAYDPPRAVVHVGRTPYVWQYDQWQRPAFRDLIICELHVADFSAEGTFRGVMDRLDHLQELGVKAVELMPIFEFKGDLGWGYDPGYFFTVEKSYGEPDDFRALIDAAHGRGIAVILDLVLAHTGHRHPFNKLYPYEESPWYGPGCGEPNQFGFPALDHTKQPTRAFVRDVQAYWLREYHVDGFRYDYCAGIGCKDTLGVPYLVQAAREIRDDAYLIAEYSPEKPDDVNICGVDAAWHVSASYALKALLVEGECGAYNWDDFDRCLEAINPVAQGYDRASAAVNYLESHDEQRAMRDLLDSGFSQERAYGKAGLGAAILFTMPGEPMLYHGQEWGESTPRKTNEVNTLHWEQAAADSGRWLLEQYRKLAQLRHDHPGLRAEGFALDASYPEQKSAAYHRWNEDGDEIVIAVNFSPAPQTFSIPFPRAGRWLDVLSGETVDIEQELTRETPAGSAAIYVKA